jgi:hypothetical protein
MNLICEAIRLKRLLAFDYKGLHRVVAPYCHGESKKHQESLRAIQIRGRTSSGGMGFGKMWTVSEMKNVQMLDEPFVPDDPNYNPNDKDMLSIHCRV